MKLRSKRSIVSVLTIVVILMFGFGFALVPIYNSLCKTLGVNGKTNTIMVEYDAKHAVVAMDREVLVQFIAINHGGLPWEFYPKVRSIKVHPGEIARLAFHAANPTDHAMTVQAIPSVTPGLAAKYLQKTECFCFTRQTLRGHEAMDMPLLFHLDPELPLNVKTITLAYTLFDVGAA